MHNDNVASASSVRSRGGHTAARASHHRDFGSTETQPCVNPRTDREKQLSAKLERQQQALHRAKDELKRRSAAAESARQQEKPDWSLALRFRLTSELRAEIDQMEYGWRADRKRYMSEIEALTKQLATTRQEKEAAVTKLMKEVVAVKRLYAVESVQGKAIWSVLKPEIRQAEKERQFHADALQAEVDRVQAMRSQETAALQSEVSRLREALTSALEDVQDERTHKHQQHVTLTTEISRLQGNVDKLTDELETSRQAHQRDTLDARREVRQVREELASTREKLTRQCDLLAAAKEHAECELTAEVARVTTQKVQAEAEMRQALHEAEQRRQADVAVLNSRVAQLRQLQQEALSFIPSGPGRQMLFLESLKSTSKPSSMSRRGFETLGEALGEAAGRGREPVSMPPHVTPAPPPAGSAPRNGVSPRTAPGSAATATQ